MVSPVDSQTTCEVSLPRLKHVSKPLLITFHGKGRKKKYAPFKGDISISKTQKTTIKTQKV